MDPLGKEATEAIEAFRRAREPEGDAADRIWASVRTRVQVAQAQTQRRRQRRRRVRRIMSVLRPIVAAAVIAALVGTVVHRRRAEAERELLARAERQIAVGEHMAGFRTLVEHAREYNTADAAERRMGLVLDVLCVMDQGVRARQELERYLELNPESVHAPRLARPCPDATEESAASPSTEPTPMVQVRRGDGNVLTPLDLELEYGDHHIRSGLDTCEIPAGVDPVGRTCAAPADP